ncbi:MAG: hypothetical protein UE295_05735 [Acutalibacteraceae bacterium]|nr:hypothetical protein [Acutalibacteraceae bacterium]
MKRIISILIALSLCAYALAGCEKGERGGSVTATDLKIAQGDEATGFSDVTEQKTEFTNNEVVTEPQTEATSKEKATDVATEPPTEVKNNKEEATVIPTEPLTDDELPVKDVLKKEYEYYRSDFYELPKAEELVNTSWFSYEVLDDGREAYYNIDVLEDVINITWNDGIDSENHNFTAPWSLKTENDVCIMQLDLGNLDGIRNYCILTTTEKNLIYFSQDFVNNDIRDYEKASRVMERSFG